MNTLILSTYLLLGTVFGQQGVTSPDITAAYTYPSHTIETTLGASATLYNTLTLDAFLRSDELYDTSVFFSPFRIDYGIKATVQFGFASLVFSHECDHPVQFQVPDTSSPKYLSTVTRIYLRLEATSKY